VDVKISVIVLAGLRFISAKLHFFSERKKSAGKKGGGILCGIRNRYWIQRLFSYVQTPGYHSHHLNFRKLQHVPLPLLNYYIPLLFIIAPLFVNNNQLLQNLSFFYVQ
jgi:hypothetical protein